MKNANSNHNLTSLKAKIEQALSKYDLLNNNEMIRATETIENPFFIGKIQGRKLLIWEPKDNEHADGLTPTGKLIKNGAHPEFYYYAL